MNPGASPSLLAAATEVLFLGGTTTFLVNLAKGLSVRGEALSVIAFQGPNEHASDFAELHVDVRVLEGHRRLIYEDRLHWGYRQLAEIQPRAVIANLGPSGFEMLRLVPPGVFRIGMVQSYDPLVFATARLFAPWCDAMVGVSAEICAAFQAMPEFVGRRIAHVPYGIPFGPVMARPTRPPGGPLRVVYLGRIIEEQKRISRVVELIDRSAKERLPIRFTIAGSGPDERTVRTALSGRENVDWLGAVSNARVLEMLQEQDVTVLLSDYEGLPLSLLEAMGNGVVPLVSDLSSGIPQAVPHGCGYRVPVGDVTAAFDLLRQLALDPSQLAPLSKAAQAHAREHFGAERMARQFLELASLGLEVPWAAEVPVPIPLGVNRPWSFKGWSRRLRRSLKWVMTAFSPGSPSRE